jgi:Protein of unknown function (DUF1573)
MNKIGVLTVILVALASSNCGHGKVNETTGSDSKINGAGKSEIVFREYQHDFGKVAEGEKISYTFTFDNKGTENLIVSSATTTCGCTVPKYDSKPIKPGSSGFLDVVFDTSGRNGMQTKTITVKSNASKPIVLIKITAEVVTNNK